MNELSDVVQYVIPENTEIVFNILSHTRNVFLVLLEGEADILVQKREVSLPFQQEFEIPVWECLCPRLKTKTGCNICVRGSHYVFSSAQKGFLENNLFIVSPSGDNYSFILEKDIQIQIFPLKCVDPESYITIRSTRGAPEISGYKLSSNTTYSLAAYSTVLLKSSDGEPYSISVQGLDRKVKLTIVDENCEMRMEAVKEHIFNQCLLGKNLKHFSPTVLVLGPKNVGKSSFCRLLVNEALEKRMAPVYIDLNVQRSLSVPGSLSLTEIEGRTDCTLDFKYKAQKLLHFGSVTFHSVNLPLYHHLVRKMNAMLLFHQRYGKKNFLTIIDTVGSQGHNIEGIDCILTSFAVDLVVVMGDQQYYETLKHSTLKTVPSEFIPKPQNIEPQNDDYKSRYYQYRIQEYFASKIGRPYVKNVRTVRLDCFKIYKINTSPKVYNAKGERIKDFKLELMACTPDMVNRLLAVPNDYVSKELFDSYVCYIIPKPELQRKLFTVNARKDKIIGYPIHIENPKYPRNQLIFNLCFVCDASKKTMQYEPLVRKLANYLVKLELEDSFLFQEHTKAELPSIMANIRDEVNKTGKCCIPINASNTIYLNVIRVYPMPPQVQDQDVPIFTERKFPILPTEWDITMQQILPYIDGFRHVAKIAIEAGVEISLVKAFIQNMVYYGVVTLIPIFMYSNVYTPTPKLNELAENSKLQEECTKYVARQGCHKPFFRSIFMLYCQLTPETNVKTLCVRHNPRAMGIDERKLIQFGLMKGIIRQLQKYPIHLSADTAVKDKTLLKYFNGNYSFEEICCKTGRSYQELEERVEKDPSVVVCWK